MKKVILTIFLLIVLVVTVLGIKETIANNPKNILKRTGISLESNPDNLTYSVKFLGIFPLALAKINFLGEDTYEGTRVYRIEAVAKTLDFIEPIFYATAKIESIVDKNKMHTLKFSQHAQIKGREGKDKDKSITYNQKKHTMLYKGEERVIKPDTQDPLSAIFYLRNQGLSVGKEFDIYFNTNQTNYLMKAKVLAKDIYNISGRDLGVWTVNAEIRRADGNPYHQTDLKFYLLDNETKTLLLIKVFSGTGIISAPLIEAN